MRRSLHVFELELVLRDRRVESTTTTAETGAWIVALSTAVPELAVDVHSTYVGGPGLPTHAAHLQLTAAGAQIVSHEHVAGDLPVDAGRRGVVLDHAAAVHAVAASLVGPPVALHVDDGALDELTSQTLAPRT